MKEDSRQFELYEAKFTFMQDANCMKSDNENEEIEIYVKNDMGDIDEGQFFFVVKTDEWSFDSVEEFVGLMSKVQKSVETYKTK